MQYGSLFFLMSFFSISVQAGVIENVNIGKDASGNTEIQFQGTDISNIATFNMTNPSMIVIDFINTDSAVDFRNLDVNSGSINDIVILEGAGKTRATINLSKNIKFKVDNSNEVVSVVFPKTTKSGFNKSSQSAINSTVDFRRGVNGQAIIVVDASKQADVNLNTEGQKVIASFTNFKMPKNQIRRMNVSGFGTPVSYVDVYSGRLAIKANTNDFEVTSYQNGNRIFIELSKPETEENPYEKNMIFSDKKDYKGTPMSLNFQQIDVRAVIQLVADYTNRNIVVSDEVTGNITLRLNEVPSDQVLETILKTKGLSMREVNGVTYIAPTTTLVTQETTELEGLRKKEELSPLRTEMIKINYARAEAIAEVIEEAGRRVGTDEKSGYSGFLSSRGSISVDPRTNAIIIQDIASKISEIRSQIDKLDVAVNQVSISSRLVSASDSFVHELGVRLGGSFVTRNGANGAIGTTGSIAGANNLVSSALDNTVNTGQPFPVSPAPLGQRLGVNLPASNPTGAIGVGILGADYLIDLELSALNDEGRGEVISSQKVMTQDGAAANIVQGSEIPYSQIDEDGKVTTVFKQVVMKLDVTPKITPNKMVDMIIDLSKDTVGTIYDGAISINVNQLSTQVLVENGETVVLGGVYEQSRNKSESKIPVLGDLPAVGRLFRKDKNSYQKNELLIFVTPRIVDKRYVSEDKFSSLRNSN